MKRIPGKIYALDVIENTPEELEKLKAQAAAELEAIANGEYRPVEKAGWNRRSKVTRLSDIAPKRLKWAWQDVIPLDAVTLVGGRGDVGKSTFCLYLGGLVTRGLLEGDLYGKPADVLLVSHEDPLAEIVVPRAIANGVDLMRFHHLRIESEEAGGATVPKLPLDADLLREAIKDSGARLVIIDPVTSTLDGDNDKVRDVRAVLDTLATIGGELGVTFVVIAHFRKGSSGSASDIVSGSHAYRDSVRAMLLFARDKEAGETVVSLDKGNYTKDEPNFAYRMDSADVEVADGTTSVGQVVMLGATQRSVAEIIANESERFGELRTELLEYIRKAATIVTTKEILEEFSEPEYKRGTVTAALSRLVKSGHLDASVRGQYKANAAPLPGGAGSAASAANHAGEAQGTVIASSVARGTNAALAAVATPPRGGAANRFQDDPGYCRRHGGAWPCSMHSDECEAAA
ncbi:AAA family ATPase [Agromyces bauzanensis]